MVLNRAIGIGDLEVGSIETCTPLDVFELKRVSFILPSNDFALPNKPVQVSAIVGLPSRAYIQAA